jgi:hypothetical protein
MRRLEAPGMRVYNASDTFADLPSLRVEVANHKLIHAFQTFGSESQGIAHYVQKAWMRFSQIYIASDRAQATVKVHIKTFKCRCSRVGIHAESIGVLQHIRLG